MLTVHEVNAVLVIAVCAVAGVAALVARRRGAGDWVAQLLALAQTLLVVQVGLGLLLLADHKRAAERLHYAYGGFARAAAVAPSGINETRRRSLGHSSRSVAEQYRHLLPVQASKEVVGAR